MVKISKLQKSMPLDWQTRNKGQEGTPILPSQTVFLHRHIYLTILYWFHL